MSFTRAQQGKYRPVVDAAWRRECELEGFAPNDRKARDRWYRRQLLAAADVYSTKQCNAVKDFDKVMLHFAIRAEDEYWMKRLAQADERRVRHHLRRYMRDLEYLEKRSVDWAYVKSIYGQSKLPPGDMKDCPAECLLKVLQMLDTHVRRVAKNEGIRPMDLPSRTDKPVPRERRIDPENRYIHIGHDLDEHHTARQTGALPF
jgi:hypothetical protein